MLLFLWHAPQARPPKVMKKPTMPTGPEPYLYNEDAR